MIIGYFIIANYYKDINMYKVKQSQSNGLGLIIYYRTHKDIKKFGIKSIYGYEAGGDV